MVWLKKAWLRPLASLAFTALCVGLVVHNWQTFGASVRAIRGAPLRGIFLSVPLFALTFVLAACAYCFLAFRRLRLRELLVVELAATAVNRLVPSGLGGLGVHGVYLHRRRHSVAEATAVVSINNLLGIVVHLSMLIVVFATGSVGGFHLGWSFRQGWALLGIIGMSSFMLFAPPVRRRVTQFLRNLLVSLARYRRQPHKLVYAALALMALTLVNVCVLQLVAHGFGVRLAAPELFLVYTAGVFVGAAVPTPGGLGGAEAGLASALIAYGVPGATAITTALTFRLITYWLPLVPGLISLYTARKRKFI